MSAECKPWCSHDGNCPNAPDACYNCGEANPESQQFDECYDCRTGEAVPDEWGALQDEMGCAGARAYMGVRDGE